MTENVSLEEVEHLVAQLLPQEQLKLVAWIGERLSGSVLLRTDEECQGREYAARMKAFLEMSEEMAAETVGEVSSAEDIRQIREQRTLRL